LTAWPESKKWATTTGRPFLLPAKKIAACGSSYMGPVQELPQAAII